MATLRVTELETTVRNLLAKNERLEKELEAVSCKLRGTEERFRQAQVHQASDQSTTERERKLQAENSKLKMDNARLHSQLQAEKSSNVGGLGWTQRNNCGEAYNRDRDDDEDLRSVTESVRSTPMPQGGFGISEQLSTIPKVAPAFKMPKPFAYTNSSDKTFSMGAKNEMAPPKKRKRTMQEEIEQELPELHLEDFQPTNGLRKKQHLDVVDDDDFAFSAIHDYDTARKPLFMGSERIKQCETLMERIRQVKEVWEHNKGAEWQFEFEKNGKTAMLDPCVTMKLAGRRTKWRQDGGGKYACHHCVKNGRPCFTWTEVAMNKKDAKGWSMWEFRLLPLHLNDRKRAAGKGNAAVRYWINDDVKFQDKDVRTKDDGDEEYID